MALNYYIQGRGFKNQVFRFSTRGQGDKGRVLQGWSRRAIIYPFPSSHFNLRTCTHMYVCTSSFHVCYSPRGENLAVIALRLQLDDRSKKPK